ncbi:hypothetical protein D4764_12G0008190 [Takifugu flavidus]|uniref:Uncharacterized protein n=1 Tax=Takifugu flavidus TaxID=433684 RepID=A0A5C6PEJ6_9TELE|nr:hypothetical protein D4764_12G0008190 [Takifugu flavidus]
MNTELLPLYCDSIHPSIHPLPLIRTTSSSSSGGIPRRSQASRET